MVCDMFEPHVKPTKRLCVAAADRGLTGGSIYLLTVEPFALTVGVHIRTMQTTDAN